MTIITTQTSKTTTTNTNKTKTTTDITTTTVTTDATTTTVTTTTITITDAKTTNTTVTNATTIISTVMTTTASAGPAAAEDKVREVSFQYGQLIRLRMANNSNRVTILNLAKLHTPSPLDPLPTNECNPEQIDNMENRKIVYSS
jgi:hypothetical protein